MQTHADLARKSITLAGVAAAARGHHVVPGMSPAPAARAHMIDAVGPPAAVLAVVVVPRQDASAAERSSPQIGHAHVVLQPNHRRDLDRQVFRAQDDARVMHGDGLPVEHEHGGPPTRHDTQRLVGRIQYQGQAHGLTTYPRLRQCPRCAACRGACAIWPSGARQRRRPPWESAPDRRRPSRSGSRGSSPRGRDAPGGVPPTRVPDGGTPPTPRRGPRRRADSANQECDFSAPPPAYPNGCGESGRGPLGARSEPAETADADPADPST